MDQTKQQELRNLIEANADETRKALMFVDDIKKDGWKILDVGAGDQPTRFSTHVIDIQAFHSEYRFGLMGDIRVPAQFTKETWVSHDICNYPWPFPDKYFDFVWCSQTLEDIRDPIGVCKEMSRVGKQGYINTPSKHIELVQHQSNAYNGFWHHRWLITFDKKESTLIFEQKTSNATCMKWDDDKYLDALRKNPKLTFVSIWWESYIKSKEIVFLDEKENFKSIKSFIEEVKNG
jgi:SAM-dependent methyltransferase